MEKEIKKILYIDWQDKTSVILQPNICRDLLCEINRALLDLQEYLEDKEMDGLGYKDQAEAIQQQEIEFGTLNAYIDSTEGWISGHLDHPLHKGFLDRATEWLSRIKLEKYATENTLKIEVLDDTNSSNSMMEAPYITLENFLGIYENYSYDEKTIPEEMKEFTRLFEKQYDSIKEKLIDEDGNPISQEEYLEMLLTMGEFRGWKEEMLIQLGEALLEVFIIFPIIEMITGTEILTGDKLTEEERALKGVSAVISLLTLGGSCLTAKGAGLAFQEVLVYAGKTLAIDAVAVGATHGVGLLCQELGVPVPLTIVMALAAGMTVSLIGTKYVLKDSLGNVQFEYEGGSTPLPVENRNITGVDWYDYFRETYGKGNVCWENCNPSEVATAWQGSYPYVGVDIYTNTTLHDGDIIWMGEPFPTGYSTTTEAIADLGNDAQKVFGGLQVKPYYEKGMPFAEYRSSLTPYKVHGELNVAEGFALNNPQFGAGGLAQRFDPNFDYNYANGFLERLEEQAIELTNTRVSLEDYFNMMDGIK